LQGLLPKENESSDDEDLSELFQSTLYLFYHTCHSQKRVYSLWLVLVYATTISW